MRLLLLILLACWGIAGGAGLLIVMAGMLIGIGTGKGFATFLVLLPAIMVWLAGAVAGAYILQRYLPPIVDRAVGIPEAGPGKGHSQIRWVAGIVASIMGIAVFTVPSFWPSERPSAVDQAWNNLDRNNAHAVAVFTWQYPEGSHTAEAKALLLELEEKFWSGALGEPEPHARLAHIEQYSAIYGDNSKHSREVNVAREQAAWAGASTATPAAKRVEELRSYLQHYNTGFHVTVAESMLEEALWDQLSNPPSGGSAAQLRTYLSFYPLGRFAAKARLRMREKAE